ncbi:DNA primase [Halorubrum ruber]|uniref:DNA primase n=1 Tax=Halorubrum ruber TaxID=2982524 RepID=A0A8T8LLP1_9EURY|nr:DNA primase [Halorubrum ruber]QUO47967.1 DNA primase [Halorubrum ruber]
MSERTTAILLIAVVALGAMTGVAAADGQFDVAVDTDADGTSTVTVIENDTAVENATVVVSVVDAENESYAGAGEYETDANGTVDLEAPEEDVTVEVTAAAGNDTAATTVELEAPDGLELDVADTDGEPVVTVTDNDTAVENATVNVTVADPANESYAGTGDYETDENGTVGLPAAEEDVTVDVTATYENESVSETVEIEAPDGLELDVENTDGEPIVTVTNDDEAAENASVTVELADDAGENASYAGTGDYETDENGTVDLPAAEEDVTVEITAEYENESVSTTADLTVGDEGDEADEQAFGQLVQEFIDGLENRDGGIGSAVSDFVTENNPGNAPDHAGGPGGPDEADDDDDENESDAPGNAPDHAGGPDGEDDGERGPPAHAGPGGDDADDDDADDEEDDADEDETENDADDEDETEDDEAEEDEAEAEDGDDDDDDEDETEDDDDDGESGPPDHAGGPGGN